MRFGELLRAGHPLSPFSKRGLLSLGVLALSVSVATFVVHLLEHWSLLDSFFYISMITTAMGPPYPPSTALGKVFVSFYSYYAIGLLVTTISFLFGPAMGYTLRKGTKFFEEEEARIRGKKGREAEPG
jgi:hypothetical protein